MRCIVRRSLPLLAAASLAMAAAEPARGAVGHTVTPGETLSSIAAVNGLSTSALAAFNGISAETMVIAGSTVMVPAPGELHASAGADPPGVSAAVADTAPHLHPHPTNERLTAPRVGDLGQGTAGMSRSLVQAIGWQESRFNNALMSSAGARGIMQVMPATWNFIQHRLAGHGLHPASAADNVRAGALYLHYLYHLKGTPAGTIASYYQGPNRTALLPDTHTYLHSVEAHQAHFRQPGH